MILVLFWQVQYHEFINYDDYEYVIDNPNVRYGFSIKGLAWAFTTDYAANWHPLTWLSHMLDCELYGLNPRGHHLNSLILHIINTLLLFMVLKKMTGALWRSAFVAALFAFHPLHVESVAWIAERKDVLSTFFCMLTMWAYARYLEKPGKINYLVSLIFFILGLMTKPMLVTLPFVLLVLDYWPFERFQFKKINDYKGWQQLFRLIVEKSPFFIFSALSSIITYSIQNKWGAISHSIPFDDRLVNALSSYIGYIFKMFFPFNLAIHYPDPFIPINWWSTFSACFFLLCSSTVFVMYSKQHPYLIFGWLWYIGTLVPVIGLIQIGTQTMADRYTYIPLTGLFIIISWGAFHATKKWRYQWIILSLFSSMTLFYIMGLTYHQLKYWENSIALFKHAIHVTSNNSLAHNNLGNALAKNGKFVEAVNHYHEALRIHPNEAVIHNNLGNVLVEQGDFKAAIFHYRRALQIKKDFKAAQYNLLRVEELFKQKNNVNNE
jgi:tetratricopeptide (TPR) repeat protein